jgi:hypothetical protein
MKRLTLLKSLVAVLLLAVVAAGFSCNAKESVPLAQAGYQAQVYTLAAVKTGKAFNELRNDLLSNEKYAAIIGKLDTASEASERLFKAIDDAPVITPDNKLGLVDQADHYLHAFDGVIADKLFKGLPDKWRDSILVARSVGAAIKVAVASIQTTTPTREVLVKADKVNAEAKRAAKGLGAADAELVTRLGNIVAETAADVIAAKGASVEALRASRTAKREAVKALVASERARIGQ